MRSSRGLTSVSLLALTLLWAPGAQAQEDPPDDPASDAEAASPGSDTDAPSDPDAPAAEDAYAASEDLNPDAQAEGGGKGFFRPADDVYQSGGFVYIIGGLILFDMSGINEALAPYDYGELSDLFIFAGTGGFVTVRQWLFGLETYFLGRIRSDGGANTSSVVGEYYLGQVAYMFNFGPLHFSPILGVGFASFDLDLVQGREFAFAEAVENPPLNQTFEFRSTVIQLSVGFDYLFETVRSPDRVTGALLGLRLGYTFVPGGWRWNIQGATLSETPEMPLGFGSLTLSIGYGTWRVDELFSLSPDPSAQ